MKKMILAALIVALIASIATAAVDGRKHSSFNTVFVSDTGSFRIFAISNTGSADIWVRFAFGGNAIANLTTDSVCVPVGMSWAPPNQGDIGSTAKGYWLSSSGGDAVTSFD